MRYQPAPESSQIKLSDERRDRLALDLIGLFDDSFDHELSEFQARIVVDHFIKHMGPAVYNQAIQDARQFIQRKLDDLDIEVYAPDS